MTFWLVLASALALDQSTKLLIRAFLPEGEIVRVLGNFLILNQQRNSGISFSLFQDGSNVLIIALTLTLVGLLIAYMVWSGEEDRLSLAGLGLICGGALGNIVDRLAFGEVIDFIDFSFWPVFNLADMFIVAGVLLFLIGFLRGNTGQRMMEGGRDNAS